MLKSWLQVKSPEACILLEKIGTITDSWGMPKLRVLENREGTSHED